MPQKARLAGFLCPGVCTTSGPGNLIEGGSFNESIYYWHGRGCNWCVYIYIYNYVYIYVYIYICYQRCHKNIACNIELYTYICTYCNILTDT